MLTFPDPSVETEYTDPNGAVWEFNGTGWVRQPESSGGGGGGGGSSYIEFLLNADGAADGSQDIVDASGNNNIAVYGDVYVSTSEKKYGTGSLDFTKGGGFISIGHNPYLTAQEDISVPYVKSLAGGNPMTLEGWVYCSSWGGYIVASDRPRSTAQKLNRGWSFKTGNGGTLSMTRTRNGYDSSTTVSATQVLDLNKWCHFALTFDGSTYRIFADGILGGELVSDEPTMSSNNQSLIVGAKLNDTNPQDFSKITGPFDGYIDDLMFTFGVCKYTDDFTPPDQQVMALRSINTSKTVVRKVDLEITDPEDEEQSE